MSARCAAAVLAQRTCGAAACRGTISKRGFRSIELCLYKLTMLGFCGLCVCRNSPKRHEMPLGLFDVPKRRHSAALSLLCDHLRWRYRL
jgi:hypothetical protein